MGRPDDVCYREEVTLDEICSDLNRRRLVPACHLLAHVPAHLLRYMAEVYNASGGRGRRVSRNGGKHFSLGL